MKWSTLLTASMAGGMGKGKRCLVDEMLYISFIFINFGHSWKMATDLLGCMVISNKYDLVIH